MAGQLRHQHDPYGTFRLDMDTRLELAATAPDEEELSAAVARLR